MITRTLTAPGSGPVTLNFRLDYGPIKVVVGTVSRAEVVLATKDPDGRSAARAISDTTSGMRDGLFTVRVPDSPPGASFSRSGGGISIQNVSGNMSVIGNRVFIKGKEVTPDGGNHEGIEAEIRLPKDSSLMIDTEGSGVLHLGDDLRDVVFRSVSGGLTLRNCARLKATTVSGAVAVLVCDSMAATTVSGAVAVRSTRDALVRSTSGKVVIWALRGEADVETVSSSIHIDVQEPGEVDAHSVSGSITVSDPNGLKSRGGLRVKAKSVTGSVTTP